MILNRCNFFSKTLLNHVDVDILLPSMPDNDCVGASLDEIYRDRAPWPTLYLLHGALDDHSCWLRQTAIERYAEAAGMAVVMPSGQNGFYTNARNNGDVAAKTNRAGKNTLRKNMILTNGMRSRYSERFFFLFCIPTSL